MESKTFGFLIPILENFVISTKFQEVYIYFGQLSLMNRFAFKIMGLQYKVYIRKVRKFQISSYVVYERPLL